MLWNLSPYKGVIRFRKQGKLGPRVIGPFRIRAWVGKVKYWLDLPVELSQIHNMFHVSQLRKYLADDSTVVPLDAIHVNECLNYVETHVDILHRNNKTLCNKVVESVKVQW